MNTRLFTALIVLYPRAWRERYAEELSDLCEEFVNAGETTQLRLASEVVVAASVERLRSLRLSRHRALVGGSATLIVALGTITIATNGLGLLVPSVPTKGPVPISANATGHFDLGKVPNFVSVGKNGKVIGYVPKIDLFPTAKNDMLGFNAVAAVQPVYGSNLKTLIGHMFPGIGYVSLGTNPSAEPCVPESTFSAGGSSSVRCASQVVTLPNVVGMVGPTGVAKLSVMSLTVQVAEVGSASRPPGLIFAMSPAAGKIVHARSVVNVFVSVKKG